MIFWRLRVRGLFDFDDPLNRPEVFFGADTRVWTLFLGGSAFWLFWGVTLAEAGAVVVFGGVGFFRFAPIGELTGAFLGVDRFVLGLA